MFLSSAPYFAAKASILADVFVTGGDKMYLCTSKSKSSGNLPPTYLHIFHIHYTASSQFAFAKHLKLYYFYMRIKKYFSVTSHFK